MNHTLYIFNMIFFPLVGLVGLILGELHIHYTGEDRADDQLRKTGTLQLLNDLIEQTRARTPEEFAAREKELGVDQVGYNSEDYI
jgi:hypothetical protein